MNFLGAIIKPGIHVEQFDWSVRGEPLIYSFHTQKKNPGICVEQFDWSEVHFYLHNISDL